MQSISTIQNISIAALAEQYGSPLYLYDANQLAKSFSTLREVFSDAVDIFYSIKANPNMAICAELRKLGACTEVCSHIELETVLKAGFSSENIIFVGPAKTAHDIARCLDLNIYAIVCESKTEFQLIADIAKQKGKQAQVALRINPSFSSKNALLKMGGQASQFGMDEDQVLNDKNFFLSMPSIHIRGIHIYNGTRILDAKVIAENTQNVLQLSDRISQEWGLDFSMVDMGGGFGVPYFDNESELDMDSLAILMQPIMSHFHQQHPNTRIILESGRYLVAKSGMLVSQILDIKTSKGENFLVTNGGTNCHMAAVGVGGLIKRNFPISLLSKKISGNTEEPIKYNITGPLCTPGDLIGKHVALPKANIGDFVMVHHSGAYGPTASPTLFLSHGFPNEVLVKKQKSYLIREAQNSQDILAKQHLVCDD